MPDLINLLPEQFTRVHHPYLTPKDLYNYLFELIDTVKKSGLEDPYLSQHSAPGSVYHRIQTFNWFCDVLPRNEKTIILDWGCNQAFESCLIRRFCGDSIHLYGCDYIEGTEFPVFHKAAGLKYSKLLDPVQLPYDNDCFDVIMASGALEHAAFDYVSLRELYRVLKPEGILIVTYLPNALSLQEWWFEHIRKEGFHMRRYHLRDIRATMKHNGFFPIRWGYQSFMWERRCAKFGIKITSLPVWMLNVLVPIRLFCGCVQLITVKKKSM